MDKDISLFFDTLYAREVLGLLKKVLRQNLLIYKDMPSSKLVYTNLVDAVIRPRTNIITHIIRTCSKQAYNTIDSDIGGFIQAYECVRKNAPNAENAEFVIFSDLPISERIAEEIKDRPLISIYLGKPKKVVEEFKEYLLLENSLIAMSVLSDTK